MGLVTLKGYATLFLFAHFLIVTQFCGSFTGSRDRTKRFLKAALEKVMMEEFKMERTKGGPHSHMIYAAAFISSLFLFANIAIASDKINIGLVTAEPL